MNTPYDDQRFTEPGNPDQVGYPGEESEYDKLTETEKTEFDKDWAKFTGDTF